MRRRRPTTFRAASLVLLAVLALAAAKFTTSDSGHAVDRTQSLSVYVSGRTTSQALPPGFLGLSVEFQSIHAYLGRNPNAINPVFLNLVSALNPGQSPVIRIGGDSSDRSWLALPGLVPPPGVVYTITPNWLETVHAMAKTLNARLIIGVNLAADNLQLSAAEARALVAGVGGQYVSSLEIGNEPDIYAAAVWYRARNSKLFYARPLSWDVDGYLRQFKEWADAMPDVPLAGPSFALPTWMGQLGPLLDANPQLTTVTYHRYPLAGCADTPTGLQPPSIANLLNDESAAGLAQSIAPYVSEAHAHGVLFRLDEINSESCEGQDGISNTFASSLWMLDTLMNLASVNADGVNVHTLTGAPYAPFEFTDDHGTWSAAVNPVYYGMLMFTQAFPPGARLLSTSAPSSDVKVWATRDSGGTERILVINQDPTHPAAIHLQVRGHAAGPLRAEALTAPSETATTGVELGGQSFGATTTTGRLAAPQTTPISPLLGFYQVTVPPGSAVLLTA